MQNDPFLAESDETTGEQLVYVGFWPRFLAVVLDSLIVGVPLGVASVYNLLAFKSFWLFVLISLLSIAYKPLMEGVYGATLGKMSMGMKVVDYVGGKINWPQAILRSVFTIAQTLVTIPVYWFIFRDSSLMEMTSYFKLSIALAESYPTLNIISGISSFILLIEAILLMTDPPYWRSLHDRIAKTYVVES